MLIAQSLPLLTFYISYAIIIVYQQFKIEHISSHLSFFYLLSRRDTAKTNHPIATPYPALKKVNQAALPLMLKGDKNEKKQTEQKRADFFRIHEKKTAAHRRAYHRNLFRDNERTAYCGHIRANCCCPQQRFRVLPVMRRIRQLPCLEDGRRTGNPYPINLQVSASRNAPRVILGVLFWNAPFHYPYMIKSP